MIMKYPLSKISITTFAIIYLFFCGGLYLIAYWTTFGFDITNYISLTDVPKSFILPVSIGLGLLVSFFALQGIFNFWFFTKYIGYQSKRIAFTKKIKKALKLIEYVLIIILIICVILSFSISFGLIELERYFNYIYTFLLISLSAYLIIRFLLSNLIRKFFPDYRIRMIIGPILFF